MAAITSSKELTRISRNRVVVNRIINITVTDDSGPVTEPVTLAEVKDYALRLTGTYDDTKLTELITEARMWIEKYTGLYIIQREITVALLNQAGCIELPGPIIGSVALTDKDDVAIGTDDYTIIGSEIETEFCDRINATYNVGYTSAPKWVKNAVYAYIAWRYDNRGDEGGGSPEAAAAICRPYKVVPAWA